MHGNEGGKGSAPRQLQQRRDVRDGDALDRDLSRLAIAEAVFKRRRLRPVLVSLEYLRSRSLIRMTLIIFNNVKFVLAQEIQYA